MNITVNFRHMSSHDNVSEYAKEKVVKLDKYYDGIQSAEVVLDHQGRHAKAEIILTAKPKHTFVAHYDEENSDLTSCIDNCIDKLAKQLRKFADKIHAH